MSVIRRRLVAEIIHHLGDWTWTEQGGAAAGRAAAACGGSLRVRLAKEPV